MTNKFKILENHSIFKNNELIDIFEDDIIENVQEVAENGDHIFLFEYKGEKCWDHYYSLEDKIEEI